MGFQNTIVQTNLPSFPWNVGDKLDAVPLNNAFIRLQQQIDNLTSQINFLFDNLGQSNLGFSMTINFGGNASPTQGPYELMGTAPYDFFITSMDASVGTNGGSFDVQITNNGTEVVGLTVSIDTIMKTNFLATQNFLVSQGNQVVMNISNVVGNPMNSWITINGQTLAKVQPIQGVGTGSSLGIGNASAISVAVVGDQCLGLAQGTSTAQAQGFAAWSGRAFGFGIATGNAHGVQVMTGGGTADAAGTSAAQAVGTGQVQRPTFVMDDPVSGVLDVNPLA